MKIPWMICGLALVASAFVPSGRADAQGDRYREKFDTTVKIDRGGSVTVSVYSGHVNVVGVSGSQMRVKGYVDRGELRFDAHSGSVRMDIEPNGRHGGNAELDITVPIGTRVQIDGFSAPYTVKGVKGEVKLESMSGNVEVADAVGRASIATVSGSILASNVDGDLRAESVSGRLDLTNVKGDIESESISGHIWINGAQSKVVKAETVSGSVAYGGTIDPLGTYEFKSHSGRVTLGMTSDAGATVSLETFSGNVDSDFPVTMGSGTNRIRRDSRFEFKIGSGRAHITLETFSGNIRIQRGTGHDNQE
ncbi:MAG: DUF4097 family beta strand repeat-containing protein [Gemmatimonadaceae bacterium]